MFKPNPICFEDVAGLIQGLDSFRSVHFSQINTELVEVLQDLLTAVEESNQLSGVDFSQNEQVVVDRARALIARVIGD